MSLVLRCVVYDVVEAELILQALTKNPIHFTSSGTTGAPKRYQTSWDQLVKGVSTCRGPKRQVLSLYSNTTYAGLSVLAFIRANEHTALIVNPRNMDQVREAAGWATYLALTPTQMRMLMLQRISGPWEEIVLGGEAASQSLLTQLASMYSGVRIIQVYASAEMGIQFVVHDGLAGIPKSLLKSRGYLDQGELVLDRGSGLPPYHTGDYFEETPDRLYFRGREGQIVNVGGVNVSLIKVREVLEGVPGILAARVIALPNPLTGMILKGEVVGDYDRVVMQTQLAQLPYEARPRLITKVSEIPMTLAGKEALCASSSPEPPEGSDSPSLTT